MSTTWIRTASGRAPPGRLILSGPEDTPFGRRYRAEEIEGRRWLFLQG
jgi:hypothetical protein